MSAHDDDPELHEVLLRSMETAEDEATRRDLIESAREAYATTEGDNAGQHAHRPQSLFHTRPFRAVSSHQMQTPHRPWRMLLPTTRDQILRDAHAAYKAYQEALDDIRNEVREHIADFETRPLEGSFTSETEMALSILDGVDAIILATMQRQLEPLEPLNTGHRVDFAAHTDIVPSMRQMARRLVDTATRFRDARTELRRFLGWPPVDRPVFERLEGQLLRRAITNEHLTKVLDQSNMDLLFALVNVRDREALSVFREEMRKNAGIAEEYAAYARRIEEVETGDDEEEREPELKPGEEIELDGVLYSEVGLIEDTNAEEGAHREDQSSQSLVSQHAEGAGAATDRPMRSMLGFSAHSAPGHVNTSAPAPAGIPTQAADEQNKDDDGTGSIQLRFNCNRTLGSSDLGSRPQTPILHPTRQPLDQETKALTQVQVQVQAPRDPTTQPASYERRKVL